MFQKAVAFAVKAHEGAVRKGTNIPYITHPLETSVIVSTITMDEEMMTAAVLHDVMEDAGITYEVLAKEFGSRVAGFVREETEDKSQSWIERKTATLRRLESAERELKILTLGDKLSNIRSTARDYLAIGDKIWQRFRVKEKAFHAWYYTGMIECFKELRDYGVYAEYRSLCSLVFENSRFGEVISQEQIHKISKLSVK